MFPQYAYLIDYAIWWWLYMFSEQDRFSWRSRCWFGSLGEAKNGSRQNISKCCNFHSRNGTWGQSNSQEFFLVIRPRAFALKLSHQLQYLVLLWLHQTTQGNRLLKMAKYYTVTSGTHTVNDRIPQKMKEIFGSASHSESLFVVVPPNCSV